jgi:hypothetical protein
MEIVDLLALSPYGFEIRTIFSIDIDRYLTSLCIHNPVRQLLLKAFPL